MICAVAPEAGASGIRISVNPGAVRTAMSTGISDETMAVLAAHAALKRVGGPADIGDLAVWLCTDEARFIAGQSILVDGGFKIAGLR